MRSEWPLVLFTLLTQAAVGTFASAGVVLALTRPAMPEEVASSLLRGPLAAVVSLLVLAALSSAGHLLRPLRAWRAAGNARASWLSVEVILFAVFTALATAVAVLERAAPQATVGDGLAVAAATTGAGLLYAMGQIYRLPSRPAWNHPLTPVSFFLTAALLGVLSVASFLALAGLATGDAGEFPERLVTLDGVVRLLLAAAALLLILEVLTIQAQAAVRRDASRRCALPEPRRALLRVQRATSARAVLAMTALAMAGWFVLRRPPLSVAEPASSVVIWTVFLFAAVESLIGRMTFYRERPIAGV